MAAETLMLTNNIGNNVVSSQGHLISTNVLFLILALEKLSA